MEQISCHPLRSLDFPRVLLKQSVIKTKRNALLFGEGRGKTEKHRQKISGLNLEADSQSTAQLEKPEWTPESWENYLYLLTAPVPPALGGCWTPFSISSPNPGQLHPSWFPIPAPLVPHLLTKNTKHLLTKLGRGSATPRYFPVSAEGKGKGFQGEYADIFTLPHKILKARTSSSVFKELK